VPFATQITVAFGDVDPANFVYFPNLFHYCHIAMERFFLEKCGIAYSSLIQNQRVGFPTVDIKAAFTRPLVYGDEVEILVSVLKLGRTSITFDYRLLRRSDMACCATATMVHVAMDLDDRQAIELPSDLRSAMASA
jgi:4-hydroxybenzoyl-CoA thioesterase